MRHRIEFTRFAPCSGDEVLRRHPFGRRKLRQWLFLDAAAPEMADGFRIIESHRREVLRWTRGEVQPP
jgi:hypothetical protein